MTWDVPATKADDGWGATAPAETDNSEWQTPQESTSTAQPANGKVPDLVKQCRTCDEVGHYTKDCPEGPEQNGDGGDYDRPPRDRSADQCYNCKEMGHFSSECPQEKRQPKPLLNWAHHPEMPAEDAWNLLKEADSTRDLDDIKEAFEVFCRNSPETTIQEIETRFRAEGFTTHLVGMEKEEMYDYLTNVNLQGEIGKQYSLGFQLSAKSRRQKMYQSMLAESPEENFERLADCGLTVKKNCIVCNHCSQVGHKSAECTEPKSEHEAVKIVCINCEAEGHRLRECPEPRKVRGGGCRNCGEDDHKAADCTAPRRPKEGEFCFNCESPDHYGKDCTEEKRPRKDDRTCHNCDEVGHIGRDCTAPRRPRRREPEPTQDDEYPEPVTSSEPMNFSWNSEPQAQAVTAGW